MRTPQIYTVLIVIMAIYSKKRRSILVSRMNEYHVQRCRADDISSCHTETRTPQIYTLLSRFENVMECDLSRSLFNCDSERHLQRMMMQPALDASSISTERGCSLVRILTQKQIEETQEREILINLHKHCSTRVSTCPAAETAAAETKNTTITTTTTTSPESNNTRRTSDIVILPESTDVSEDYILPHVEKSKKILTLIDSSLKGHFIFDTLLPDDRRCLIDAMSRDVFEKDSYLMKQGDKGDYLYVVESGTVAVIVDDDKVKTATTGYCFGEVALLHDCTRNATVMAESKCVVWKVDKKTFRSILTVNRKSTKIDVVRVLRTVPLVSGLDTEALLTMAELFIPVRFVEGALIVAKGAVGEVFYIVMEGSVKIHDIGHGDSEFVDQVLRPGEFFGERALLTGEPRAANVTALTDCSTLCLSRKDFNLSFGDLETLMIRAIQKRCLEGIPLFAEAMLESSEINMLVDHFCDKELRKGTVVVEQDDEYADPGLYIIQSGKVIIVDDVGKINILTKGDHFGDDTLRDWDIQSSCTIRIEEDTICHVLNRSDVASVLGSLSRLSRGTKQHFRSKTSKFYSLSDFKVHGILGRGAFGEVMLVTNKRKTTPTAYALKALEKRRIIDKKQVTAIVRERNILASVEHPFILNLVATFQDELRIYMLIDYIQGGELLSVMRKFDHDRMPEGYAMFYSACILQGLSHLHHLSIVYRDMKPENVLIDKDGYAILIDMGFAKIVLGKTYTFCGTPQYIAPETILTKGYSKIADYWTFGILIYELLTGRTPFYQKGNNESMKLFKRIIKDEPKYPKDKGIPNDVVIDLLRRLFAKEPKNRIDELGGSIDGIINHDWFRPIDFRKLVDKNVDETPWKPNVKYLTDASNYNPRPNTADYDIFADEGDRLMITEEEQDLFVGFA